MKQDFQAKLLARAEKEAGQSKDDFILGGNAAIELLWHGAEEEPKPGHDLLIRTEKGIKAYPNPKNTQTSWEFFVRISHARSWAYSEDILPGEKEGKAPE